ncbi:MAG TPA: hypothetical protein VG498_10750, partial [Terriglobales bacterium]|nr:hypothetical protein [Terriglobales bacterium]
PIASGYTTTTYNLDGRWVGGHNSTQTMILTEISADTEHRGKDGTLFPLNADEDSSQAPSLFGINHFYKTDSALEMRAEVWMSFAILRLWSVPDAVCKRRFQCIKVSADDVWVPVHYKRGSALWILEPYQVCQSGTPERDQVQSLRMGKSSYIRCSILGRNHVRH